MELINDVNQSLHKEQENERNYVFLYNGGPFFRNIKVLDDRKYNLENAEIFIQDIKYKDLEKKLKKVFKNNFQKKSFKFIQITFGNGYFDNENYDFLFLDFSIKFSKSHPDITLKLQEVLKCIFNSLIDYKKYYHFYSNVFLDFRVSHFIEEYIKNTLKSYEIGIGPKFYIEKAGAFFIEMYSFINVNFELIICDAIRSYFNRNFPNIMGTRVINVFENKFHFLLSKNSRDNEKSVATKIVKQLYTILKSYNLNFIYILDTFWKDLLEVQKAIEKYDPKTLQELNNYFYRLEHALDTYWDMFPSRIYGKLIFFKKSECQNLKSRDFFIESREKNHFRENKEKLINRLTKTINFINNIRSQKTYSIKSYRKDELNEILDNVENEEDFRKILINILEDLGYHDISMTHGVDEWGKDIVFSNRNRFRLLEWNAIVVKKGKINTDEAREMTKKFETIINQFKEAFEEPYRNDSGSKHRITRVFIATNEKITTRAKKRILNELKGQVFFIEKKTLMNLF